MDPLVESSHRFRHDGVLGTVLEFGVAGFEQPRAEEVDAALLDEIRQLESTFSIFDYSSELWGYRRTGKTTNADLIEVLDLSEFWWRRSQGAFHPAIDLLRDVWQQAESRDVLPNAWELAKVVSVLSEGVHNQHLNLNAIAKGWIADRALDVAFGASWSPMAGASRSVWASLGGDVVHRGAGEIHVGIEDPHQPFDNVAPLTRVAICNQALATSGNTRRSLRIQGQAFGHVLDPRTGMPAEHIASASVIANDAATADVLATVALVLTTDQSLELIDSVVGASCLLVAASRSVVTSARWPGASDY